MVGLGRENLGTRFKEIKGWSWRRLVDGHGGDLWMVMEETYGWSWRRPMGVMEET